MRLALTYNVKDDSNGSGEYPEDHYAEWDDLETIEAVRDALKEKHEEVELIEADLDAYDKLRDLKPELVFNMAEGLTGESREAHIPAILEMLGIPYTGSSPLTLAMTLNKARSKQVLSYFSVPTPKFVVMENEKDFTLFTGNFPAMVKPLFEGSSKGIRNNSLVNSGSEMSEKVAEIIKEYKQPAIVEEFLPGREFTVAMLGNGDGLKVLPLVEMDFSTLPDGAAHIYSYEAKWIYDTPEKPLEIFTCPADVDTDLRESIEEVCIRAFNVLDVRDWCRTDVRLDEEGVPNIIELNPLPGIIPAPECNSCFPKAARAMGMDYKAIVNTVVESARERYDI